VVRVPGYKTQMYCASSEVRTEFVNVIKKKVDRICGLVVRVPGYRLEIYCVSCEVRTEFVYVIKKKVDRLCGQWPEFLATDPEVRVRFLALPDFLRSSGSGTGST
jgi:hypothetical protein